MKITCISVWQIDLPGLGVEPDLAVLADPVAAYR